MHARRSRRIGVWVAWAAPWVAVLLLLWTRHPSQSSSIDRLTQAAAEASVDDLDIALDHYWSALSLAAVDVLRQGGDVPDAVRHLSRLPTPKKHVAGYRQPQDFKITVLTDGSPSRLVLVASAEPNRNLGGYVGAFGRNDTGVWNLRGEVRVDGGYEIERVWRSADGNRLVVAQSSKSGTQSSLLKVTALDLEPSPSSDTFVFVNGWPASTQTRGVVFNHSLSFLPWDERWAAHKGTASDPFEFWEHSVPWSKSASPTIYSLVPIDQPEQIYPQQHPSLH